LIQAMLFDIDDDRRWREKVDALSTADACANFRCRNINAGHIDDAGDAVVVGDITSASNDRDARELLDTVGFVPMREVAHGIAADNQEQFRLGMGLTKGSECLHRIGGIVTVAFDITDTEPGRLTDCAVEHGEPVGK